MRSIYSKIIFWGDVQMLRVIEICLLVADRQVDQVRHHNAGDALLGVAGGVGGGAAQPGLLCVPLPGLEKSLGLMELALEVSVQAVHGFQAPPSAHLALLGHLHEID